MFCRQSEGCKIGPLTRDAWNDILRGTDQALQLTNDPLIAPSRLDSRQENASLYGSRAYSARASSRTGTSGSAFFQSVKRSW